MTGRPERNEAAPYYSTYIDRITSDDVVAALESQLDPALRLFATITEEQSLHRYAPDKWSIRQLLNHVSDTERVFLYRALWFARGFDTPLPGFDQNIAVPAAAADQFSWPVMSRISARSAPPPYRSSATCPRTPGPAPASPAATR
jgi:hypothetical protein